MGKNECIYWKNGWKYLQSYDSIVCKINDNGIIVLFPDYSYSNTTKRHVSKFLNIPYPEIKRLVKEGFIKVENE